MATIKAIERRSVHQIQAGQVIVDLCSVVKELVENSLDAGATSIDIRFKNHGLESIEVQDNGRGISSDDYETLALKHYTSKLRNYDDLGSISTFGFRGEALSSLCALSRLHVITAQEGEAPKGSRLEFELSGKLKSTEVSACQKGTTIIVEDLFNNLPVRRRELEKNIKREYGKVLSVLQAYACVSVGVRYAVTNQVATGKKTVALSTKSSLSTKDNIANVYGAKTVSALIVLELDFELQRSSGQIQTPNDQVSRNQEPSRTVRILGHISKPIFGEGRQTPDRQMYFVNSRPCALPQISKAINEVYRSYNVTQSPFVFADLRMDTNSYDVNVSPDKRMILLHDQANLVESLKTALSELFESQVQTVPQSQLLNSNLPGYTPLTGRHDSLAHSGKIGGVEMQNCHHNSTPTATSGSDPSADLPNSPPGSDAYCSSKNPWQKFMDQNATERPFRRRQLGRSVESMRSGKDLDSKPLQQTSRSARNRDFSSDDVELEMENDGADDPGAAIAKSRDISTSLVSQQRTEKDGNAHAVVLSEEDKIPSIQNTAQKRTSSLVQLAYDRARPKHMPAEIATITIGDKTATAIIGKSSELRRPNRPKSGTRSHEASLSSSQLSGKFQSFALPNTALEDSSDGHVDVAVSTIVQEPGSTSNGFPALDRVRTDDYSSENSDISLDEDVNAVDQNSVIESRSSSMMRDEICSDDEYVDEEERRRSEEHRIADMVRAAEIAAVLPSQRNLKRVANALKGDRQTDSTVNLKKTISVSAVNIEKQLEQLSRLILKPCDDYENKAFENYDETEPTAEERLSLAISKSDFPNMRIVGQFNLGFILATRSNPPNESCHVSAQKSSSEDLFIIDQHASDEICNFSRLSISTTLTPQRLAQPLLLNLTALEEEIVQTHTSNLVKNGFLLSVDDSGELPIGQRCKLLALPTSKDIIFTPRDLEELIALLTDAPDPTSVCGQVEVIRPSRVRRMLAMRACRSSIMVGRELTKPQMRRILKNMGDIERPWNCPHGRPTMRHLAGLDDWTGWVEGDGLAHGEADIKLNWIDYLRNRRISHNEGNDENENMKNHEAL